MQVNGIAVMIVFLSVVDYAIDDATEEHVNQYYMWCVDCSGFHISEPFQLLISEPE